MVRAFFLLILILLAIASAFAQSDESSETAENAPESPAILALEFRTYELGWIRFRNVDADGERKLAADAETTFPFQRVNNGTTRLRLDDLDAETIADLIEEHEIAWDEDAIIGQCDPNKLPGARADLFCVPGTKDMEQGQIFLALFDGETGDLLALTESIDNKAGGALKDWSPTPEPAETATGCGPYNNGQWIPASVDVSGHGLPIVDEKANVTDYQCVVAADGSAYFQAHHFANGGGANGGGAANGYDPGSGHVDDGVDRRDFGDPIPDAFFLLILFLCLALSIPAPTHSAATSVISGNSAPHPPRSPRFFYPPRSPHRDGGKVGSRGHGMKLNLS